MTESRIGFHPQLIESDEQNSGRIISPRQVFPPPGETAVGRSGFSVVESGPELPFSSRYVPLEMRNAGALLGAAMQLHRVSPSEIASKVHVGKANAPRVYIENFIAGANPQADLGKILQSADLYIDSDDANMLEIREIHKRQEEERKWLWHLEHDKLPIGDAVRYMRLMKTDGKTNFASRQGITAGTLTEIESGDVRPSLETLNTILTNTSFEDKYPKAAKLLRLRAVSEDEIGVDELDGTHFGKLVKNVAVQLGYTQRNLTEMVGKKSDQWISKVIYGHVKNIDAADITLLLDGMGLPDEIKAYMYTLAGGENVEMGDDVKASFCDNFYIKDSIPVNDAGYSREEIALSEQIYEEENFGTALLLVRTTNDITRQELLAPAHMRRIEKGTVVPEDYLVAQVTMDMGYDILNPVMAALLSKHAVDKKKHKRGRFTSKKAS